MSRFETCEKHEIWHTAVGCFHGPHWCISAYDPSNKTQHKLSCGVPEHAHAGAAAAAAAEATAAAAATTAAAAAAGAGAAAAAEAERLPEGSNAEDAEAETAAANALAGFDLVGLPDKVVSDLRDSLKGLCLQILAAGGPLVRRV